MGSFTKSYISWKEDIARYEIKTNEALADNMKISLVADNIKGPLYNQLMINLNQHTTFDQVDQMIKNFYNSVYLPTANMNSIGAVKGKGIFDSSGWW